MCLGVPVVSTNCRSGPSEILHEAERLEVSGLFEAKYGLLVPTNDVEAMAGALGMALEAGNKPVLGTKAKQGAARYDVNLAVSKYWAVVEHVHPSG
jgi:glycosyltransferase involved in cell wall biosynthesis